MPSPTRNQLSFERPGSGDLWGALAAAAVLLPQAMAFGVTLYAIAGRDASSGAYAGLVGTAVLCVLSGFAGATRGLISAPTGPVLVLLGGALGGLVASDLDTIGVALGLSVTIALTGVLQFLIGASGGGRLIKYIPFPVVSGFMTGSAILMITSQIEPLRGSGAGQAWSGWIWLPGATALVTIAAARVIPRFAVQIPGPIAGLIAGAAVFHLLALMHGGTLPAAWMIGALPSIELSLPDVSFAILEALPWRVIAPAAAALAILASLDTLLTAVVADVQTGTRHDSRRELMGQGAGQMVSGLLGGMAGAGTTAATVIAIKSGGGRWVTLSTGVFFALLTAYAGDLTRALPIGALAGVIIAVAFDVADRDILTWLRRARIRQDAAIAILVTLITVLYDLMIAVAVGVLIAIVLFIRDQIRAPVVHRRSLATEMRSILSRPADERALLDAHGERIIVYELRGNLFFGTADRLLDELGQDLEQANWIIVDLRKVTRIDLTALKFFQQIANRLHAHGGQLLCCELHHGTGIDGSLSDAFRMAGGKQGAPVLTFNGRDEALEFAENALLEALATTPTQVDDVVALADNRACAYLNAAQIEALQGRLGSRDIAAGERLFGSGDSGTELYLVARGKVEIRVATTRHHYKRLALYGAGGFFGELALLKSGARAADAIAISNTRCWILERSTFETVKRDEPALAIALLAAICDTLVSNQRWSTAELSRLSEW